MRLIDADALIDEIKYITGQDTIMWFDDKRIKRKQAVNMAAFIELMPTIDPVKHGKWLNTSTDIPKLLMNVCSECGFQYPSAIRPRFNYCPNCGAKNGGEG